MTPVGVFFICQNEDKCHFVNSTELGRDFFRFLRVNYEIRQKSIVKIHKNMPRSQKLLDGRI